ncbi:MAG: amidase [Candidatus Rokubacteria bacterium]|nr:amidase [Candidatus Rokubacteria bacterium]
MTTDTALEFATIAELAARLRTGAVSPVQLAELYLERIAALDKRLHAFIEVTRDRALAEARAAESLLRAGHDRGPLHGIPYAVKDLYDVKGLPTTGGTRLLAGNVAAQDCHAVRQLAGAGMVLLGKTHTVQFAFGGVGINHDQGTPHNPWSATPLAPGGSSSGSGVAVGAALAPAALGTDTGGSVRIPAALCGTVGLKTTVGRIGRSGVYPLSWTLDSVGPLTRSVEDAALLYQALQGEDLADDSTRHVPPHDVLPDLKAGVKGLRLAFGETLFFDDVDPDVAAAVREAGHVFRGLGAAVDGVAIPEAAEAMAEQRRASMIAAEALVVNGRLLDQHFDALDPVVAHRMKLGRGFPASDYVAVLRQWGELRARVTRTLAHVDAVLVPATMIPPRPVAALDATAETYGDANMRYLRNTAVGNILGLCAVVVPGGFTRDGLPIGLMIYAKAFDEATALRVAWAYEQATPWRRRRPDLAWAR